MASHSLIMSKDFRVKKYNPSDFPITFGNDGEISQSRDKGLTISSVPFTSTIPVGNEHPKWLHYYKETFCIPQYGEFRYEGVVSARQVIPVDKVPAPFVSRIRNIKEDIRLATAGINMYDPDTWMVFDFFLSDQNIYAFYERLPFGKNVPPLGDYHAFSYAILVGSRTSEPESDFIRLAIGYSRETKTVTWYIDNKPVFFVNRIGLPLGDEYRILEHGGLSEVVDVEKLNVGFGTFSLLDMALPNNYARQLTEGDSVAVSQLVQLEPVSAYRELYLGFTGEQRPILNPEGTFAVTLGEFPDDNRDIKLFGQGAILNVRSIQVSIVSDY